ncbi:MAG: hypothetical protein ACRDON_00365 [Gaiellaceae bacterium]
MPSTIEVEEKWLDEIEGRLDALVMSPERIGEAIERLMERAGPQKGGGTHAV